MEVSQEQLLSIALNVLGYIAAGLFWMMLYSFFKDRKKLNMVASSTGKNAGNGERLIPKAPAYKGNTAVEFINLSASSQPDMHNPSAVLSDSDTREQVRRNRAEVIRLAREMLKANHTNENIKHTLPITEGELAMLKDN